MSSFFEFHFLFAFPSCILIPFSFRSISDNSFSAINTSTHHCSERHLSSFDDTEKAVQVHLLELDYYYRKETYGGSDQIEDSMNPLRKIDEANWLALTRPFRNYNYNYARGMMKVHFSSTFNPKGATYGIVAHIVDVMKVLSDNYCFVMLDGQHWHRSVENVQNEDRVEWASAPLRMY